jgi:rhamnulokinase
MSRTAHFIAADLGASSGRIMLGEWNGRAFSVRELHRFPNTGVRAAGTLYWDILGIWSQIQAGLRKYNATFAQTPDGIAVDAWGVDFGLLDGRGRLIGNPVHYRDSRTWGMTRRVFEMVPEREWFAETGVQTMPINTLFQLSSMVREHDPALDRAQTLLMIPDLCGYLLCGEAGVESTEASTTQMFSPRRGDWARELVGRVNLPVDLLPAVMQPGTVLARMRADVVEDCGFARPFPAIAVASHDTASAVAAIPGMDAESVFLSSGTWSLMGIESAAPDISDAALRLGFSNEGGAGGFGAAASTLLLKNMTGLWIVQECLRHWSGEAYSYSWSDLVAAAAKAAPFKSLIDPDAPEFQAPRDMPRAIAHYCIATGQPAPQTEGEIARCAFESLSLNYRSVLDSLRALTGRSLGTIRVVGGGGLNAMLCQMTADACACEVVSGPAEASTLGNVMLQAVATGHLAGVREGREAIAESVECSRFSPHADHRWDEAYARFHALPRPCAQQDLKSAAAVS